MRNTERKPLCHYALIITHYAFDLHHHRLRMVQHLHAVAQRGATPDSRCDVDGLGHLLHIRAFLQAIGRVRVDTVRALDGVRNGQRDERLLAGRESAVLKHLAVIAKESVGQLLVALGNPWKVREVLRLILRLHRGLHS